MAFNVIDILLLVLVLLSVLGGYRRGFILGVLDLAGWILSLLAGLRFYQPVARWIALYIPSLPQIWSRPIGFILIAVVMGGVVQLVGRALLKRLPKATHERQVNRLFGVIPGLANGLISAAIASALLLTVPLNETGESTVVVTPAVGLVIVVLVAFVPGTAQLLSKAVTLIDPRPVARS